MDEYCENLLKDSSSSKFEFFAELAGLISSLKLLSISLDFFDFSCNFLSKSSSKLFRRDCLGLIELSGFVFEFELILNLAFLFSSKFFGSIRLSFPLASSPSSASSIFKSWPTAETNLDYQLKMSKY